MGRRDWLALLLLAPIAVIAVAVQVVVTMAALGAAQAALGARERSSGGVERGVTFIRAAAHLLDSTLASPIARAPQVTVLTLGTTDELRAAAHALAVASDVLTPASRIGIEVLGFDGATPMISGTAIDTSRIGALQAPVEQLHGTLRATEQALAVVPTSGLLGRRMGEVAQSVGASLADLGAVTEVAQSALPHLAEGLGAQGTRRYLLCALNDAEVFASGGAPLSAWLVEASNGSITVPVSGQMESKLSPNNPPILWDWAAGPPWYLEGHKYPFVNSNFHPDFRTAARDMQRAWAALGYPPVDGVLTVNVGALTSILKWTGPLKTEAYGEISSETLVSTLLVEAYRRFEGEAGVLERHARNAALTKALGEHFTRPRHLLSLVRGTLEAIPPRHLQAWFAHDGLQGAVRQMGAHGALTRAEGDLIGVFSQAGPSKLSVFHEREIRQDVQLTPGGGAEVTRTVRYGNAVPPGLQGDPTTYRGYLALRARLRVAYRMPMEATSMSVSTGQSVPIVRPRRVGPHPDGRGGLVLWQGQDIDPGQHATVEVHYTLPDGTFPPGTYTVDADPQPLTRPASLTISVTPAPGQALPDSEGWTRTGTGLQWQGSLDQPLSLAVG